MFNSQKNKGILVLTAAVILGGLLSPLIKIGVNEMDPNVFTFLRFVISGLFLLPLLLRNKIKLDKNILKLLAVSTLAAGNVILFSIGIKYTSASVGATLYILSPIMVATISFILLKERISRIKFFGILLGFLGGLFLITLPLIQKTDSVGNLFGNLIICAAIFCVSLYAVLSKPLLKTYSPVNMTMAFSLTTLVLLLFPAIISLTHSPINIAHVSHGAFLSLFYVGAVGTAAYYVLQQYGIKHVGPTTTSTVLFYLQPVVAVIFSFFALKEIPTISLILGALITASGAWIVIKSR